MRTALDKRDGFNDMKRAKAYGLLSNLAGHASPEGMIMLVPVPADTTVHCGPFLEGKALNAVLSEAAVQATQAAGIFRRVIKDDEGPGEFNVGQKEARLHFMQAEADWTEIFFDAKLDRAKIEDMRTAIALVKERAGPSKD